MSIVIASLTLPASVERWLEYAPTDDELPNRIKAMFEEAWGIAIKEATILRSRSIEPQLETYMWMRDLGRDGAPGESAWEAYGFDAESRMGEPVELPLVDIEKALPLILCTNYRSIWLDYRPTGEPRVVLARPNPEGDPPELGRVWSVIAETFDEFLERYLPDKASG